MPLPNHWIRDPFYWSVLMAGVLLLAALRAVFGRGVAPAPLEGLLLALCYPLLEEFVFRGLLQPWLLARTGGRALAGITLANLLTSVAFALAHLPGRGLVVAVLVFAPSLVFGYFRDRHASLWPAVGLHAGWNATALWLLGRAAAPL